MNNFFRRLPLRIKLMLIGIIPLLFLFYLSFQLYNEKSQKARLLSAYIERINQSENLNTLIDYLQKERKISFDYAVNKELRSDLYRQRPLTDHIIQKLKNGHDPVLNGFYNYTFLNDLPDVRSKIDSGFLSAAQVMQAYTDMIFRLNTLNTVAPGSDIYLNPVYKDLISHKILSEMITYLGIMRSNIYNVLYTKKYMLETLFGMYGVHKIYGTYETELSIKGSDYAIKEYHRIRNQTSLKPTVSYLDTLFKKFSFEDNQYDATSWWKVSDQGIEQLTSLQKKVWSNAESKMRLILHQEETGKKITLLLLVVTMLFIISIVFYTIHIITKMLAELENAAEKLSVGATGLPFKIESNDEIGNLGYSIAKIDQNNRLLANAADAIGQGDFSVPVQPRSKDDILGNAIVRMKNDLQKYHLENEEKIWIHVGMEAVNKSLIGEKDIPFLAKESLDILLSYLNCTSGAFYITNGNTLECSAESSLQEMHVPALPNYEVLAEEAFEKQLLYFSNNLSSWIKLTPEAGNFDPSQPYIVPLEYHKSLEGAIMLFSQGPLPTSSVNFLIQVQAAIAAAVQAAKSRALLQEMYEEVQSQAEELEELTSALKESENHFRLIANLTPSLIWQMNEQGKVMYVNQQWIDFTGLSYQESMGEGWQSVFHPENLKEQPFSQAFEQRETYRTKARLKRADGEYRHVLIQANPIFHGIFKGYIGSLTDITDQELAQQSMAELMSKKDEFMSIASHELKTPITSVKGALQIVERIAAQDENMKQLRPFVEKAGKQVDKLTSIVADLLDITRIQSGELKLNKSDLILKNLLNDCIEQFQYNGRKIITEGNADISIYADKVRLEQVLCNLISNAVKYSPNADSVIITINQTDKEVKISVTDFGIGIAEDKIPFIFDRFFRIEQSSQNFSGLGLGLYISSEIISRHKGRIGAESKPGEGSTFWFTIPLKEL